MRWPCVCSFARLLLVLAAGRSVLLAAEPSALATRLDEVFSDERLASASIGALVVRSATGEVLYERNADRSLVPASNMKLVTGLASLDVLGANFRYTTEVRADGPPDNQGWVVGDLYLHGSGDPTLSHADLDDLASQLATRGIARVTDNVVADDTCFSGPPLGRGWSWDNETYAYAAQVSGLSVDGNAVAAEVAAGVEPGAPCSLTLEPPSSYLMLDARCVTGDRDGERPTAFRRRAQNTVATTGPVPLGVRVSARVTVEGPALYAAVLLRDSLLRESILVGGGVVRGQAPSSGVVLATHRSAPLTAILAMMNRPSDNHIAEALLRTIPRARRKPGTADAGAELIRERLTDLGIDVDPLRICDGSGLSRYNLLTARALVGVLRHASCDPQLQAALVSSLPVAGLDGTLSRRMRNTAAEGVVRAKTGSLWGVSALSGYVDGSEERTLTFSFIVNNYTCGASVVRGLQDRACAILAEAAQG